MSGPAIREDSYLGYWLSLPWRCKLGLHKPAVFHEPTYTDTEPPYNEGDGWTEYPCCGSVVLTHLEQQP